jgi:excinuclease ABC subunit B
VKNGEREPGTSRIQRDYQPVQPTFAQSSTVAGTRARKPSLDEMGSHSNRPIPARSSPSPRSSRGEGRGEGQPRTGEGQPRTGEGQELAPRHPDVDPRTKAGAYGEDIRGPHKPTLDEMGPHAERGLPVSDKPRPLRPAKTIEIRDEREKKQHRHGRPRKTGRPGA